MTSGCYLISDISMEEQDGGADSSQEMGSELEFTADLGRNAHDQGDDTGLDLSELIELEALQQDEGADGVEQPDGSAQEASTHFVTTWRTNTLSPEDRVIELAVGQGEFLFDVDWDNDQIFDQFNVRSSVKHEYPQPGVYTVRVRGRLPSFVAASGGTGQLGYRGEYQEEAKKLQSVDQWGTIQWESMAGMFEGAAQMHLLAVDSPDLSQVRDMKYMFAGAQEFNEPIGEWDTSHVTSMEGMFEDASLFDQPIGEWDTSRVASMRRMFEGATFFNQPIGEWNVSRVESMHSMFLGASSFDQPIGEWDTMSLASIARMFEDARVFNQPIGDWDVSRVDSMRRTFASAKSFNQPLGGWDTSNVNFMSGLFNEALTFNQPLDVWDTSSVTSMENMFAGASAFDQPLSSWDLGLITLLDNMLDHAGLSVEHYDTTLQAWSQQSSLPESVRLGAEGLSYCAATMSRKALIQEHNWVIQGDSWSCPGQ